MVYRHLLVSHVVAFPSDFGEKRPHEQNALKVIVGAVGGARRRVPRQSQHTAVVRVHIHTRICIPAVRLHTHAVRHNILQMRTVWHTSLYRTHNRAYIIVVGVSDKRIYGNPTRRAV